ncbi:MAG: LacI family DNA-binding transcriptional regulator [Candidatus Phosphoribacter sp.]|nr:LacI family DNA-binding transcriptional regulator [Actinomycetales bacterium]
MTQPTISDVARAAGVSNATVSRALRGLGKVHPETRDRVFKAAAALDYIASPTAAGLASGRTGLVGIITPFIARWFFSAIMSSIEKTLRDHQHHILPIDLEMSPITRLSLTQGSLFKRVDGLIVINVEMQVAERDLVTRLGLPVVAVGYPFEDAPRIRIDDFAAVTLAAEHLIDLGHRSIAYLGKARSGADHKQTPSDRLAGFRDTLDRHGLSCPDEWVLDSDWSAFDAHGSALRLLSASEHPTAILAASDEMGLGALAAARELGLDVPGDLSIIGIDDHELAAVFGLTTVRQDVAAQGTAAASAMLAELGLLDESFGGDRIFPVELVSRRSTGAPASLG